MIGHARTRSVNGHAIGLGIDARREHERAIVHKHLDRRGIANNAHVTNLVDGLPAHGTTAAGRSATLIGKSHLKARGQLAIGGHKRQLQLAINGRGKRVVDTVNNNVKAGIAVNPNVNKDIFSGINRVKAQLMSADGKPRLFVFSSCVNLIREFKTYSWGAGDLPKKYDDHALDELRYYLQSKPRPCSPSSLPEPSAITRDKLRLSRKAVFERLNNLC